MNDKIIAEIQNNNIAKLISPKSIGQKEAFRIFDTGNLGEFPVGSKVEVKLESSATTNAKLAVIVRLLSKEAPAHVEEIAEVINLQEVRKEKELLLSNFSEGLHFYVVFNPLFNQDDGEKHEGQTQAHSFFNLLKNEQRLNSNSYLYWGKIKSADHSDRLCSIKYQNIVVNNKNNKKDTYLFISDFSFFWVAKIEEVSFDVSREDINSHSLEFYKNNYERVEAWFKVIDMTLLSNTSKETLKLVSDLIISKRNSLNSRVDKDNDVSISPYLSGLRYPLIIEDKKNESYFGTDLETQKENPLMGDKSLSTQTKDHINGYVIPPEVFSHLSNSIQREIITAEIAYANLSHTTKDDIYAKDYDVARKYLIVLEKVLNDTLGKIELPRNSRIVIDRNNNLSLNDIAHYFFDGEFRFLEAVNKRAYYAIKSLCKRNKIKVFSKVRNNVIHMNSESIAHELLINIRREILGVGKLGYINTFTISVNPEIKNTFSFDEESKKAG